ncbi:hypothetical protein PBY51_016596 [Eleginops maclovinus]|uniref:X-linked retinitis pigmentosa GTPase regulator n=1 Tax=Eleginops maclovinus TaxID=56733 RepID=A0AAN7W7N1_ELEMC|nr:hypothetical protein PBY51_016596 [Eleginops maclovinus]
MAGESEDEIPESGAVFTFGKSKFAENVPSKFWLKNDVPLKIACGDEHTALITENGKLFMFGSNNWGQLGLGSKVTVNKPTCVKALKSERVHVVACGRNHTLIYTAQGRVFSSGGNSEGQLGLGDCEERTSFQRITFFDSRGPIKMLAAGSNTSAALTEGGDLFMWGDNTEGQIGLGKESHAYTPQEVSVGRSVSWVSCGYYHSAFVTEDGGLYTFGEWDSGKLGLSTEQLQRHRLPQLVGGLKRPVTQVACGGGHTVALTEDDVFTFGLGQFGQLGHGTFIFESRLPRRVEHFKKGRVCQVICGENHTAVITDGGLLYTFGDGRHGKLGLGEENFTNQFKPTLCPRFLKYNVQAVTCGGCHMVVLARPRDPSAAAVTLEDDDVTEDFLEKPYVELPGDMTDSSTLQRSLSARVRRRERERSPEQFGSVFGVTPGLLQPPPPLCSHTSSNRQVLNGTHQHGSAGSMHQGDVAESLTDSDSVKGLGETSDFLNMTHVMKMDPGDKTLTLSPVQKRKGKHGKSSKVQIRMKQSRLSSHEGKGVSPRRALPTELLRSPQTHSQNKENLILAMEELQRPGKNQQGVGDIKKAASKQRLRPAVGKSQLMEVARKKQGPDLRKRVDPAGNIKAVQSKPVAVQRVSSRSTHTQVLHLSDALEEERVSEVRSNEGPDLSKKSKNERNRKEAKIKAEDVEETPTKASKLRLLAGAASLTAGALIVHEVASRRSKSPSPSLSESISGNLNDHRTKPRGQESEPQDEEYSNRSAVSINIIPQSPEESKETSQEGGEEEEEGSATGKQQEEEGEEEEEEDSATGKQQEEEGEESATGKQQQEEEEERTSADVSEKEEDSDSVEKETEDEEEEEDSNTLQPEEETDVGYEVSKDEKEEVRRSEDKVTEEEEEEDSNTLQTEKGEEEEEEEEEEDKSSAEEEEEEEASGTAGSETEDESESKESRGSDVEEEEEEEEGSSHETESAGAESESEEEGEEEEEVDLDSDSEEEEGESESLKSSEEEEGEESDEGSETEGEEEQEENRPEEEEEERESSEEESEVEDSEKEEEEEEERKRRKSRRKKERKRRKKRRKEKRKRKKRKRRKKKR